MNVDISYDPLDCQDAVLRKFFLAEFLKPIEYSWRLNKGNTNKHSYLTQNSVFSYQYGKLPPCFISLAQHICDSHHVHLHGCSYTIPRSIILTRKMRRQTALQTYHKYIQSGSHSTYWRNLSASSFSMKEAYGLITRKAYFDVQRWRGCSVQRRVAFWETRW